MFVRHGLVCSPVGALALALCLGACSEQGSPLMDAGRDLAVADLADLAVDTARDSTPPAPDLLADTVPPFAPAVCGVKAYSWLPGGSMGKVVTKKKSALFSLSKGALALLIGLSKYKGVVTPLYDVTVYLVRYETRDRGKKIEATMAMAYPTLPPTGSQKAPYVLWTHGTSGFSDACAPTKNTAGAALPVALMASQGYIGVTPDYIGMNGFGAASTTKHAYLVGEPTAIGSLDALRAAGKLLAEVGAQVQPERRVVLWGGSQGGHAALFSALYAP